MLNEFYKRSIDNQGSPDAQVLAAMLVAREKNNNQKPIYGVFVVGLNWNFIVLDGNEYFISRTYLADGEGIFSIFKMLKGLKQIIIRSFAMNAIELKQACVAKLEQIPEHKLQEALNLLDQLQQDLTPTQQAANDKITPKHTRQLGGMAGTAEILGDIVEPTEKLETGDESTDWLDKFKEVQQLLKQYIPEDRDIVAELIAERRQAAKYE